MQTITIDKDFNDLMPALDYSGVEEVWDHNDPKAQEGVQRFA